VVLECGGREWNGVDGVDGGAKNGDGVDAELVESIDQ
jgi:hypothetical protein